MAHFAKLDENNIVLEVNVVDNSVLLDENGVENEQKGIDFLISWSGGYTNWKQTSYNNSFRKHYACIGYTYDYQRDAFIPSQPYPSWILREEDCVWIPPKPYPTTTSNIFETYCWSEEILDWVICN